MNSHANAYARARTIFGFRIKRVWFKLNPSLERSHTTEEESGVYYQPNSKFVIPRQSIVLCEDTDDESLMPTHRELSIAAFWNYLYSNSWGQRCSLRILDGELLDTMLTALFVLERDGVIIVHTTRAMTTNARHMPVYYKRPDFDEKTEAIHETLLINFTYYGSHEVGCDDGSVYPYSGDTSSCCSICDSRSTDSGGSIKEVRKPLVPCPHGHHQTERNSTRKTLMGKNQLPAGNRFHLEMLSRGKKSKKPKGFIDSEKTPQVCESVENTVKTVPVLNLDKFPCSKRTKAGLQQELESGRHHRCGEYYLHLDTMNEAKLSVRERLLLGKKMKQDERKEKRNRLQKRREAKTHGASRVHITGEDVRAVDLVTRRLDHKPSFRSFIKWTGKLNSNRQKATRLVKQFKYKLSSATDLSQSTSVDNLSKTSSHQFTKQFAEEVGGVTDSVAIKNAILNFQLMKAMTMSGTHLPVQGVGRRFVLHEELVEVADEEAAARHRGRKALETRRASVPHLPAKGRASEEAERVTDGVSGSNTDMSKRAQTTQLASVSSKHMPINADQISNLPWVRRHTNKVAPLSSSGESSKEQLPQFESHYQPGVGRSSKSGKQLETLHFRKLNRKYSWERFKGKRDRKRPHFVDILKRFYKYRKASRLQEDQIDPPQSFKSIVEQMKFAEPVPMVLGKLKRFRFQENCNYKTSIHDMDLSDFKGYDSKEFISNLLRAMGNFVVRKEDVTTSYGLETLTTVTFTRPGVFRPVVH